MISFALFMVFLGCLFASQPATSIVHLLFAVGNAFAAAHLQKSRPRVLAALLLAIASAALVLGRTMMLDVGNFRAGDYGALAILAAAILFGGVLGYSIAHWTALERRTKRPRLGHHELAKRVRLWKDTKGNMRLQVIGR